MNFAVNIALIVIILILGILMIAETKKAEINEFKLHWNYIKKLWNHITRWK